MVVSRATASSTPVKGNTSELAVKLLQACCQRREKVGPAGVVVRERQAQALDRLAASGLLLLLVGFLEQLVVPWGAPKEAARLAIRSASRHR